MVDNYGELLKITIRSIGHKLYTHTPHNQWGIIWWGIIFYITHPLNVNVEQCPFDNLNNIN